MTLCFQWRLLEPIQAHTHRSLIGLHLLQEPSKIEKTHISFWQSISICSLDMVSKHQVEHCCHFGCLPRQTRAWSIFMFFMVLTLFHRAGAKGLLWPTCAQVSSTPDLKAAKHRLVAGQGWDAVWGPVWCNLTKGNWEIKLEAVGGIHQTFPRALQCQLFGDLWFSCLCRSWHVCFSLPKSVCPTAKSFFSGALAATRAETHQDYGGVVLHVTNAMREFHWQRASLVPSL